MSFEATLLPILKELAGAHEKPVCTVSDHEVSVAARKMARTGYDFTRTPNSLKALKAYLAGKALVLAGTTGVGKTLWFKALRDSGVARHPIFIYSLTEHGNDFANIVVEDIKGLRDFELVLDDVGTETTWNGTRNDELLTRILAVRECVTLRTHFTTNLPACKLRTRYDERVVSRLHTCEFIAMTGADNRQAAANDKEAEFRRKCEDPASWRLCDERCPFYVDGRCTKGKTVPPELLGQTPESMCGVGTVIPYRPEELEWRARFNAENARRIAEMTNCLKRVFPNEQEQK